MHELQSHLSHARGTEASPQHAQVSLEADHLLIFSLYLIELQIYHSVQHTVFLQSW